MPHLLASVPARKRASSGSSHAPNDLFVSTPHRVVNDWGCERCSIPVFYDPDFETVLECLPNCSGPGNPPGHPRTIAGEYITAQ